MATNLYGKSCTPNTGGVLDFYTKSEVNALLAAKAGTSTTYTRAYLDGRLSTLENSISSLSASALDQTDLDTALGALQAEIEGDVAATYATLANTYTKAEVDGLISTLDLDPDTLLRKAPTDTATNTVDPGANNAIALTLRGSSTNAIVQRWLDNSGDTIGYVSNDGTTTLEGPLTLGRLVSDGSAALNVSGKRITGLADPTSDADAVPYEFLKTYVLDFYEEISQPNLETPYVLNAGEYSNPSLVRDSYRHLRSSVKSKRPLPSDLLEGELAINTNSESVGLFVKDTLGKIRKIGPAYIGLTPPSPTNYTDLSDGEMWIDKSGPAPILRYYDESGDEWIGVVIDAGSVTSTMIADGTIVDSDISETAEIAVSKLADGAARQLLQTDAAGTGVEWTSNVDVPGALDVTGIATFDTLISIGAAEPTTSQQVGWNANKGTLDIGLLNGVLSPLGQDIITLCRNGTTSPIPVGTAVMFTGETDGNSGRLYIAPMVSDGTYPGYVFFGVAAQNIAAGADGYVRSFGEVKGVDTDIDEGGVDGQWAEGDILWCDPATPGGFTKFEPQAPNLKLPVAAVISVGNNGIVMVRWDTGRRLSDLHDVESNGTTADNELLAYNATTSRWENKSDITIPGTLSVEDDTTVSGDITLYDGGTFSTTLQMVTPTADRTISFPDATGTVALVAGSSGQLIYNNAGKLAGSSSLVIDSEGLITTTGSFKDPAITGTILEEVYTISDGVAFEVDPSNGSVQLITLGASRTPKATNFAAGEAVTLMIDDGTAYTLTWTDTTWGASGVVWTGGSAPTLATSGYTVVQFWKVGTQVYGAYVGDVA